ncbi:MAG: hypothetical protein KF703_02870 [Actinobacteria bacterium]|nr:hypothetical protein [Actinomycetota bacterium]
MPEAAPPDADRAGGRPRLVRAAIGAALLLLVAAPIVAAGWSRERQHWYPEGDDATIVLLSRDTFSSHPPLLGMISTGGASLDDPELHHPGPLELYLLSPFAHVGRQPVPGVTVAAVAVGVVALGALGWALLRLGGPGLAGAGLVAAGLVLWGLGGDVPASVWNPFVVAVPFAAFLALAVATAGRRPGLLPWMLAAASFVMQTHLSYVGQVGLVSAWVLAVVAWRLRRDPELGPDRARLAAWSVGVVAVLWAPPLWQQVTGSPGNLGQILRSATGPGGEVAGTSALGELGRVVGVPVLGLRPRPDIVRVLPDLDVWSAAALALPWVALLGLAWWAHRRGDRTAVRALATLGVVLLGAAITATRIPLSDGVLYQYYALWMWPVGALTWVLLGWAAVRGLVDGRAASALTPTRPELVRAGVAVVALLAVVVSVLPRPGAWAPWAAYRRIAGQVVDPAVEALPASGPVTVRFRGGTAYLSTGSALVLGVEAAGHPALVDPGVPTEVFPWTERRRAAQAGPATGAELWVVSGADPADLPAGARRLVEVPTLTDAEQRAYERDRARLVDALAENGLADGPRHPAGSAERAQLARAHADPAAALDQGLVAQLAAQGLVHPPGGDLHRVFTTARMGALAAEGTVRVYLVG